MSKFSKTFAEINPKYSLRPYQKKAVNELIHSLTNNQRVLLHAPTGAGKTRMAMTFITNYFRQHGPTMVLWLAPGKELATQAAKDFQSAWSWQGDVPAAVIEWHGSGESFSPGTTINRNTLLVGGLKMTVQSVATNRRIENSLHEKVSLVVFDEAHQSIAPSYRNLVENLVSVGDSPRSLVGLSATPGRANVEESKALARMYGGLKIGVGDGGNPVHFLQANGYLARTDIVLDSFEGSPKPVDEGLDYSNETLLSLGEDNLRNECIVDIIKDLFKKNHRRVLAFTPSIESAELCAETMRKAGFSYSHAVSGLTNSEVRDHIVSTYLTAIDDLPSPQVIFNCNVLTAGFDAPQTSAVLMGRPTKSMVRLQQVMGRAIRGPASGGNEEAEIRILVDDTYEEFTTLADLFLTWDSLWDPIECVSD